MLAAAAGPLGRNRRHRRSNPHHPLTLALNCTISLASLFTAGHKAARSPGLEPPLTYFTGGGLAGRSRVSRTLLPASADFRGALANYLRSGRFYHSDMRSRPGASSAGSGRASSASLPSFIWKNSLAW